MPRLTITIPTFNRAHLLEATMRSVLEQSFSDFELFVSDNASTDHTAEVVAGFNDPRITYLRSDENLGHFWNLSRGLHLGNAPFVGVLPDDDRMLPGNLEKKVALLESDAELGLVHSAYKRVVRQMLGIVSEVDVFTDGKTDRTGAAIENVRRILSGGSSIEYPSAIFRRSIIDDGDGFAPEDKGADDVAVALRIGMKAGRIAYLAEPLVAILFHEQAGNQIAGGCERVGDDIVATYRSVCDVRDAKLRFISRHEDALGSPVGLAQAVRRRAQQELLGIARIHLGAHKPVADVAHQLLDAIRIDPGLLARPELLGFLRAAAREARARIDSRRDRVARWARGRPPVGLVRFGSFRRVQPIEADWFARGKPVDRYYIEQFLRSNAADIRGRVVEVGDRNYTAKFASAELESSDVLDRDATSSSTIVADLSDTDLDIGTFDCVICVQTVQMIFDSATVFRNLRRLVAPGGTLLVTAHWIGQFDASDRWSDVWRFSPRALTTLLQGQFGIENVEIAEYGNVLSAVALLHGLSAGELRPSELDAHDPRYPVVVAARAVVPVR